MEIDELVKKRRGYEANCRLMSIAGFYASASYLFGSFKYGIDNATDFHPDALMLIYGICLLALSIGLLFKSRVGSVLLVIFYFLIRFVFSEIQDMPNRNLMFSFLALCFLVYGAISTFMYNVWDKRFIEEYK